MKVSIIVPVYNVEQYIEKCLTSLVNQTLDDIEVIVVNDGSPDNSQVIIDKFVKKYPNKIKSFIKKNGGQGSARNFGLMKATGDYIGYVDSDDYIAEDMYEKMYNQIIKEKADIVICNNYLVNGENISVDKVFSSNYFNSYEQAFFGKMAVWNKLYRKDLLVKNKLKFAEKVWYEDLAFTTKAIMNAKKVSFINEPLYYYIIRKGSTMNNNNVKRNLELLLAFDDLNEYLADNVKKSKYNSVVEFLAIDHIYISGITRIIQCNVNKKMKMNVISEYTNYIKKYYSNFKNNKYIKTLPINRKLIYKLVNLRLFFAVEILFKLKEKMTK